MINYQAVLFDLDGVILDSLPLHHRAARQVFQSIGHNLSYVDYKLHFGGYTDQEGFRLYCKLMGSSADASALVADKARIYRQLAEAASFTPYPGAIECIKLLVARKIPIGLVTGTLRAEAELVLKAFGLTNKFSAVVAAEDVARSKPSPEGYLKGAASLGIAPKHCIVIEDAPAGIQAACAAGMQCIAVATTFAAKELRQATVVVGQLHPGVL